MAPSEVGLERFCQKAHEECSKKTALLSLSKHAILTTTLALVLAHLWDCFPAIITCNYVFSPSIKHISTLNPMIVVGLLFYFIRLL